MGTEFVVSKTAMALFRVFLWFQLLLCLFSLPGAAVAGYQWQMPYCEESLTSPVHAFNRFQEETIVESFSFWKNPSLAYKGVNFDITLPTGKGKPRFNEPQLINALAIQFSELIRAFRSIDFNPGSFHVIVEARPHTVFVQGQRLRFLDSKGKKRKFKPKRNWRVLVFPLDKNTGKQRAISSFAAAHEMAWLTEPNEGPSCALWREARTNFLAYAVTGTPLVEHENSLTFTNFLYKKSQIYGLDRILNFIRWMDQGKGSQSFYELAPWYPGAGPLGVDHNHKVEWIYPGQMDQALKGRLHNLMRTFLQWQSEI